MRNTVLVGQALIDRARDLSDHAPEDIARACGYVGPGGRVLRKAFLQALVEARGLGAPSRAAAVAAGAGRGRQAEYRTRVHGNGNLLIGQAYTRRLGLAPGQECRIELHQETGTIWLRPLDHEGGDGGDSSDEAPQLDTRA
jgi:bifunctional DNA-binding transcriptional regulator/antitoxin component of YhaV-PrlF toxin-antitoxin module